MSEYKLVPVEPTLEMIGAARDCADCLGDIYRAMLAAAPAVSAKPVCITTQSQIEAFKTGYARTLVGRDPRFCYVPHETDVPLYLHPPAPAVADKLAKALRGMVVKYHPVDSVQIVDGLPAIDGSVVDYLNDNFPEWMEARAALAEYDRQRGGE